MNISSKYLTPVLTIAIIALGFFQASNSDGVFTDLEKWQLASLLVGAIVTYYAPLATGKWVAIFKVGGAVVGAVLAAIITGVTEGSLFDVNLITVIVLAGLNALAAQVGSDQRVDAAKEALAAPNVSNAVPEAVDPVATEVAKNAVDAHDGRTGI
ncbi:hypothetical protein SEA_MAGRITTE_44 [Microbacterium phage Magritte]|nr:hypothetical protein SEA_MAGRITTE_44 [Microbacterium phage Magritte]